MQIFINTQNSSTLSLTVHPSDTVQHLKDTIIKKQGIFTSTQFNLQYCSKYLKDDINLGAYNLQEGSTLFLMYPLLGGSYTKTIKGSDRKATIHLEETNEEELKNKIKTIKGKLEGETESPNEIEKLDVVSGQQITLLEYSDDNDVIMVVTNTGRILDYNFVQRKVMKEVNTKYTKITSAKRSRMNGMIALGSSDNKPTVIHTDNHHQVFDEAKQSELIEITPDGNYIFCKAGRSVERWSLPNKFDKKSCFCGYDVGAFTLSSDGQKLYVGGSDIIQVYSVETCEPLETLEDPFNRSIILLKVTKDGRFLISVRSDRSINILNLHNKTNRIFTHIHVEQITSIALTPDNRFLFSGSTDKSLVIYDLEKLIMLYKLEEFQPEGVKTLIVTADGQKLLSGGSDGKITVYDINNGDGFENIKSGFGRINCLSNLGSGNHFVVGCDNGSIKICNSTTGKLTTSVANVQAGSVYAVAGSPDGRWIAAGFADNPSLFIFSSETGEVHRCFKRDSFGIIDGIVFTNDSRLVITCSADFSLQGWELDKQGSNDFVLNFKTQHTDRIRGFTISKDDNFILTASWDHSICVSKLVKENNKFRIEPFYQFKDAHDGPVNKVTISSNNKYIVSVGSDLVTKIFDLDRRDHYHTFKQAQGPPSLSVDFALNNQCIVTASEEGRLSIFSITTKKLIYSIYSASLFKNSRTTAAIVIPGSESIISSSSAGEICILNNPFLIKAITVHCGSLPITSNFGFCLLSNFISDTLNKRRRSIEIIKKYSDLYVYPYNLNFLHIVALFAPDIELIDACIESKIPMILDQNGLTPLHYLIYAKNPDITIFNYFLARFGDLIQDENDQYEIMCSLSNHLPAIIQSGSFQAANFLKYAFMKPRVYESDHRATFGSINPGSSKFVVSDSTIMTPILRGELAREGNDQMLSVKVLVLKYDYSPVSEDMLKLMLFLDNLDDAEVYKASSINMIVEYLWTKNRSFYYYSAILYSAVLLLVSVYSGLTPNNRSASVELAILAFGGILLAYELILLFLEGWLYAKDIWNYVDIAVHLLLIAYPITVWNTENDSVASKSLLTALLCGGYLRWLSYFIVVDQTRRLIKIIQEVVIDMASFFCILVFMTFGFTLIFVQYTMSENNTNFGTELYNTYNLYFGNVNDTYTAPQMIYFLIFTVFVSIVMLNMLIAIINETFGRISDNQAYYESEAKISLIIEAIMMKRFIRKFLVPLRRFSPKNLARAYINYRREGRGITYIPEEALREDGYLYIAKEITKDEYEELMDERKKINQDQKAIDTSHEEPKYDTESLRADISRILRDELKMLLRGKASGGEDEIIRGIAYKEQKEHLFEPLHKAHITKFQRHADDE